MLWCLRHKSEPLFRLATRKTSSCLESASSDRFSRSLKLFKLSRDSRLACLSCSAPCVPVTLITGSVLCDRWSTRALAAGALAIISAILTSYWSVLLDRFDVAAWLPPVYVYDVIVWLFLPEASSLILCSLAACLSVLVVGVMLTSFACFLLLTLLAGFATCFAANSSAMSTLSSRLSSTFTTDSLTSSSFSATVANWLLL